MQLDASLSRLPGDAVPVSIAVMSEDAQVRVTRLTQNELANGKWNSNTEVDHVIKANGEVLLHAEHAGCRNGRVYTLHFTATNLRGYATGSGTADNKEVKDSK